MGIFLIVFILLIPVIVCISRLKISNVQKGLWLIAVIIITFSLIAYFFVQGFERGRERLAPPEEELHQPIK